MSLVYSFGAHFEGPLNNNGVLKIKLNDHPQEELAKFGHKIGIKVKTVKNP